MKDSDCLRYKLDVFFMKHHHIYLKKHEHLLQPYQNINYVYYLYQGSIRQYSISKNGNELTLVVFNTGTILFFLQLLDCKNATSKYFYQALTPCKIYVATLEETCSFLRQNTQILIDFMQRLGRGLEGFLTQIESIALGNADEKLATLLLTLSQRFGQKIERGTLISLPLTHYDLSCMVGTSRETASTVLKKMERAGIIFRRKKQTVITNPSKLEELALSHT